MKKKSNDSQSLIEVWKWKDKVYEKLRNKADKILFLQKDTEEVINRLGLKRISMVKK